MSTTIKIAAVQPALALGEVEANLRRVEELIRDAHREHHADVITVPEAASCPNVYSGLMRGVARPVDGAPMQLYRGLSRELGCVVGGGFLARRGADVYGTYVLAEPDGAAHLHDKDIPTMWEQNFYRGGDDPGIVRLGGELGGAPIGVACGWEWARTQTMRRLVGNVELLLGGMCWPSYPRNWKGPAGMWADREHDLQRQYARELPRQVARMLGVAVAMPSHVGPISFDTPMGPGITWGTDMLGETQIVERDGSVLARLTLEDGEGHVSAEVGVALAEPLDPIHPRYWIPVMSASTQAAWHAMNAHGAVKYKAMKILRKHPWQQWPGTDLPDEIAPSSVAEPEGADTR